MTATASCNIARALREMAEKRPDAVALALPDGRKRHAAGPYRQITYRQLDEDSDWIARGFLALGIRRGMRTVLMVKPGDDFFAITFALFKLGAVIVMVDPGLGVKRLGQCLFEASPDAFIGIPRAHAARKIFGWARNSLRITVTVGKGLPQSGASMEQVRRAAGDVSDWSMCEPAPQDMAAILFTSGSTGVPKGAVYTHGNFLAQVTMLKDTFGIQEGEIDLCTFPLFSLFSPAMGMMAVVPDMDASRPGDVDPAHIIDPILRFGVTNMFGSPALLDKVSRYGKDKKIFLPSLRRVLSAGAPVSYKILERFHRMLEPDVEIFTPYGATESLPVSSIGSREILQDTRQRTARGEGICVGRPVRGMDVKIMHITDDPVACWSDDLCVAQGEIGEIAVRGPVVSREYYHRPESNALAKIAVPEGAGFYHRMGDVGYFSEDGRLWFCGRKSQRVVTGEGTLYTIPCESVFHAHPRVYRTALVGVREKGGTIPVLCVELERNARHKNRHVIRDELLKLGGSHHPSSMIRDILFHDGFPVDVRHNAKIYREQLAAWAAKELGVS